jgi:hypothetical protein
LLAHDPSEGVHHIAFAAPVRADHSGYAGGKVQAGFFVKGFESGYFELFKLHVILLLLRFQTKNFHRKGAKDAKGDLPPPCLCVLCAFAVKNIMG